MRAVVYREYGSPRDVLKLEDVEVPMVDDNAVLLRVQAAAVNPGDWDLVHGTPYVLRLSVGFRAPRKAILGLAVAGQAEAVGRNVTSIQAGDRICAGISRGGFADYVVVPAASAAPIPASLTYEQAAAAPVAAVTALQGLRDVGHAEAGQRVLINGASGGVGTFAVQIAKHLGAEVTGVCSTRNVDLVRSIGANHVVDYTQEDFTESGRRYDLIFDNVGNRSLSDCRRALAHEGILIPNSNKGAGRWIGGYLQRAVRALVMSPFVSQKFRPFAATENRDDLIEVTELIEAGKVTPVIERTYALDDTAEALHRYGEGHTRGKLVIGMGQDATQKRGD
jgi:NADPH:quinone reductase-like Zn-dependent oxidoreductase